MCVCVWGTQHYYSDTKVYLSVCNRIVCLCGAQTDSEACDSGVEGGFHKRTNVFLNVVQTNIS